MTTLKFCSLNYDGRVSNHNQNNLNPQNTNQNVWPNNKQFQPLNSSPSSSINNPNTMDHFFSQTDIYSHFLHIGHHLGLTLVSHILIDPYYNTLNKSMQIALKANNKIGFVDGIQLQPLNSNSNASVWSQCNNVITLWFLNAISKDIV